ncbi:MAG: tRNA (guanosine(46)-N7)-methyltransferase TrmB [Bacilli bacterium]|nr:tRNA (guanosine(46)-N7)-methyltransferase TrmB [Bacilli bacterium]
MRLRNNKDAKGIITNSEYVINNPKDYKGKWNTVFNNNNKLYIEIGCGKGDFIIANAINHPENNYIAIEKYDTVLMYAVKKIEKDIPNLRFIRMDALEINEVFDKEVDLIYLNFSDPWPKERHAKRRLTHERFLKLYDDIFKSSKTIFMKTDNIHLFEFSIESLSDYGYKLKNISLDLINSDIEENFMTEYEKKFSEKGTRINRLEAYKD